jgi:hypothetical protein
MGLTWIARSVRLGQDRKRPTRGAEIKMPVILCRLLPSAHIPKEPTFLLS